MVKTTRHTGNIFHMENDNREIMLAELPRDTGWIYNKPHTWTQALRVSECWAGVQTVCIGHTNG